MTEFTDEPDEESEDEVLFSEPGASWWWLITGPIGAVAMLGIEINAGLGPQPLVPLLFLFLVSGFMLIQIKAARIHTCVTLTRDKLIQGTETLYLANIVRVLPPADTTAGAAPPKWQSSRALGELHGVPRRRTGIGLKLTGDRTAQAWAQRHRQLRAALNELVDERRAEDKSTAS